MNLSEAAGLFLAFLARLITGAQGHWYGCPPKAEQRIYFANHQSHFDWVLIWAALPREPGKDAADALGLAITHAHAASSFAAIARATPLARKAHAQYKRGRTY